MLTLICNLYKCSFKKSECWYVTERYKSFAYCSGFWGCTHRLWNRLAYLLKCTSSHKISDKFLRILYLFPCLLSYLPCLFRTWTSMPYIFFCDICSNKLLSVCHSSLSLFFLRFTETFNVTGCCSLLLFHSICHDF